MPHRHGAQRNALGLKVLHHRVKALVLLAQQVAGRDAHIVKNQLGRVRRQPAGFLERAADCEARRAFFNNEDRHVTPARTSLGRHKVQIGMHAVGDEHLGAVDHPFVAFTPRVGADAGHVRAGARLADADRRDQLARSHTRQVTGFLCGRTRMVQVRAGHVGVHQHSDDEAGKGGLRQRLGKHQVGQRIALAAAVLALVHEAQQSGPAHTSQHIARHHAGLFPGGRVRLDFFGDESGDLVAQQFVLGGFVDGGVHGESLKVSELFLRGNAPGKDI